METPLTHTDLNLMEDKAFEFSESYRFIRLHYKEAIGQQSSKLVNRFIRNGWTVKIFGRPKKQNPGVGITYKFTELGQLLTESEMIAGKMPKCSFRDFLTL